MKWEPDFYEDVDGMSSDDLAKLGCCTICGVYIENLPGYYYIESGLCPNCRLHNPIDNESWSEEAMRVLKEGEFDEETIDNYKEQLAKFKEFDI